MNAGPRFLVAFQLRVRRLRRFPFACFVLVMLITGCGSTNPHVDRALMADGGMPRRNEGVTEHYTVGCPDVVEATVQGRPDFTGRWPIGPDGCMTFPGGDAVRVEGRTLTQAARSVAAHVGVPTEYVHLRVVEYNSQEIYLSGPGIGTPRSVPYRGQETVLDLLQRVGGVTPAVAPENVYVVRSHVAEGDQPEVFHIDLNAIVVKKDQHTNLRLQPFDQVYVGETRQGKLEKCLPPWIRPLYQALWGIGNHDAGPALPPGLPRKSAA